MKIVIFKSPPPTERDRKSLRIVVQAALERGARAVVMRGESGVWYEVPIIEDPAIQAGHVGLGHDEAGIEARYRVG